MKPFSAGQTRRRDRSTIEVPALRKQPAPIASSPRNPAVQPYYSAIPEKRLRGTEEEGTRFYPGPSERECSICATHPRDEAPGRWCDIPRTLPREEDRVGWRDCRCFPAPPGLRTVFQESREPCPATREEACVPARLCFPVADRRRLENLW